MIEQKPSSIEEAPSLEDITSAGERVGRVDFTAHLGADTPDDGPEEEHQGGGVALASMARPTRADVEEEGGEPVDVSMPLILPPAKIDEAMAAEAAATRRAIAEARGELVDEEDEDELDEDLLEDEDLEDEDLLDEDDSDEDSDEEPVDDFDEQDLYPEAREDLDAADTDTDTDTDGDRVVVLTSVTSPEDEVVEMTAEDGTAEAGTPEPALGGPSRRERRRRRRPAPEPEPEDVPAGPVGEGLMIQDVASLKDIAEEAAAQAAAEAAAQEAAEAVAAERRREAEVAAAAESRAFARLGSVADLSREFAGAEDLDDLLDDDIDDYEDDLADLVPPAPQPPHGVLAEHPVDASVTEVAASIIAMMQATEEAHQRHLEAVELEAARRCELLTAQAELDAELIRLQARREAHAIVSAARTRAGDPPPPVESDQLSEIGETFSRFAETIEATLASSQSSSPDTPRKS